LDAEILGGIQPFQGSPADRLGGMDVVQSGGVMQKVETAYTTAVAVQKPRSLTTVVKNVLEEAKLAKSAFYFKWPVKNRSTGRTSIVQGGSIDLARSIARNFGNVAVDIIEEPETLTHYKFKAVFIDLETGLNWPRLFKQRKSQKTGMADTERAEDIIFQIGQSKAQRNAVFQGVPGWLVDKAIEVAEQAEVQGIKDEGIEIARVKVLDFFAGYGVDQDRIELKLGKKVEKWIDKDIADLRASATAIKEGRTSVAEMFPQVKDEKPDEKPAEPKKDKKTKKTKKKPGRPKGSKKKDPGGDEPEKVEGDDKGGDEKTDPDPSQHDLTGQNIEDLINSDIWHTLQERKAKFPQYYLRVTRGQTPGTIEEVEAVIEGIDQMIDAERGPGVPGA
jgi:hypothetical protein